MHNIRQHFISVLADKTRAQRGGGHIAAWEKMGENSGHAGGQRLEEGKAMWADNRYH